MKQHIFFEILKTLDKDELNRFEVFLNSPYFNTRKSLIKLFELSLKAIETGKLELISKKTISEIIYRNKDDTVQDDKIRRLLSDFTILLDQFLLYSEFDRNEHFQNELLVESLRKHGLESRFSQKIVTAIKILERSSSRDEKFYLEKISLSKSQSEFEREFKPNIKSGIDQQINDLIDNFFIISKLHQFHLFYSNQYIHQEKQYNWTFFDNIKTYIEENLDALKMNVPEIYLRYKMLILLLNPQNKSIIDECISYIETIKNEKGINLDSYYIDILNLCSLMLNSGDLTYNEKVVQISKEMDLNKVWDKFHFLGYSLAKIIIESAIIQKEFQWLEYFIINISEKIEPEFKKSFTNLMFAKMYFFQSDYNRARVYQARVLYEDFIFYTDAKGIEARIEFEEENYFRVPEIIDSLKKYLKSHKEVPDKWKSSFSKFGDLIMELVKYYEKKAAEYGLEFDLKKKENEIIGSGVLIYGTEWLLDKFRRLMKK